MAQRLALIIGNSDYLDETLARLLTPDADTEALRRILVDPHIGAFDEVKLLNDRSHSEVRREIAAFFQERGRDDLLLLYFSGHGVLDDEGQLYLATTDTQRKLLDATAVSAHFVNRQMRRSRSRRQVLILDCCHSGAFARGAKGSGVGQPVGIGEAFAGDGSGHIILTASKATEYAFEGDEIHGSGHRSIFTHQLIEGLETGEADLDEDGRITPEELYDYAYSRVRDVSPRQTPGKWVYEQTGEITLAQSSRRKLPAELETALLDINPMVRFNAVEKLGDFLGEEDPYLAKLAADTLGRLAESDDSRTVRKAASQLVEEVSSPSEPVREVPPPVRRDEVHSREPAEAEGVLVLDNLAAITEDKDDMAERHRLGPEGTTTIESNTSRWETGTDTAIGPVTTVPIGRFVLQNTVVWGLVIMIATWLFHLELHLDDFRAAVPILMATSVPATFTAYQLAKMISQQSPSMTHLARISALYVIPFAGPFLYGAHLWSLIRMHDSRLLDEHERIWISLGWGLPFFLLVVADPIDDLLYNEFWKVLDSHVLVLGTVTVIAAAIGLVGSLVTALMINHSFRYN